MQKSNYKIMIVTGFLMILLLFIFKYEVPEKAMGRTVATIDDLEISYAEFKGFLKKSFPNRKKFSDIDRRFALDQMINQKILLKYAKENTDIEEKLSNEFKIIKEAEYQNLLIKFFYKVKFENVDVDMANVKQFYQENEFISLYFFEFPNIEPKAKFNANNLHTFLEANNGIKIFDKIVFLSWVNS